MTHSSSVIARRPKFDAAIQSNRLWMAALTLAMTILLFCGPAFAGGPVPFTINMSEAVTVTGCPANCPRIAVDVGGVTRYASYASGSGTAALTFNYQPQAGDLDLDGIALSSPIDLNGGSITDLNGNAISNLAITVPNTSGIKINYPSLSMDFVASDYILSGTHYGTLPAFLTAAGGTFTRNSVGTYYDAAGVLQTASANTPRFDYDPVTHAAKGILIEESRTNYTFNSNTFNAGGPSLGGVVNANAAMAPDGNMVASEFVISASSDGMQYNATATGVPDGKIYTGSVYLKAGTLNQARIQLLASGAGLAFTSKTVNLTNQWQRFDHTIDLTSVTGGDHIRFRIIGPPAGTGTFYAAFRNIEQGAFPTSYIPTAAAAVTRAADNLTMPTGGWYDAVQGTLYGQSSVFGTGFLYKEIANLSTNGNNRIRILMSNPTTVYQEITTGGSTEYAYTKAIIQGAEFKSALGYKGNDTAGSTDGGAPVTDMLVSLPSIINLTIGSGINGTIKTIKYYPARVANTQLQLLTQ
jgi:hypothetical protein